MAVLTGQAGLSASAVDKAAKPAAAPCNAAGSTPRSSGWGGAAAGAGSSSGRSVTSDRRRPVQLFLDLGQRDFSASTCLVCGMVYTKGQPEDEALHKAHHTSAGQGIKFPGWAHERVLLDGGDQGRLLLVLPTDEAAHIKKVREVIRLLEWAHGLDAGWLLAAPQWKVVLCVMGKRLVAAAVVEPIRHGYREVLPGAGARAAVMAVRCQEVEVESHSEHQLHRAAAATAAAAPNRITGGAAAAAPPAPSGGTTDDGCSAPDSSQPQDSNQQWQLAQAQALQPPQQPPQPPTQQPMQQPAQLPQQPQQRQRLQPPQPARQQQGCINAVWCGLSRRHAAAAAGASCSRWPTSSASGPPPGGACVATHSAPLAAASAETGRSCRSRLQPARRPACSAPALPLAASKATAAAGGAVAVQVLQAPERVGSGEQRRRPVKALVGVRLVWVSEEQRRRGLATKLLDAARCNTILGYVVPRNQVAFQRPSSRAGAELVTSYGGDERALLYGDDA